MMPKSERSASAAGVLLPTPEIDSTTRRGFAKKGKPQSPSSSHRWNISLPASDGSVVARQHMTPRPQQWTDRDAQSVQPTSTYYVLLRTLASVVNMLTQCLLVNNGVVRHV